MAKSKTAVVKAKTAVSKGKPAAKAKPSAKAKTASTRKPKPATAKRTRAPKAVTIKAAAVKSIAGSAPVERVQALWDAVGAVRAGLRDSPRTARLLAAGPPKMAQKVVEEAAEVAIEAVAGERVALVNESVDLIYNLVVLWNTLGVAPSDIWAEMDRREAALGMAEKLPKTEDGV